MADGTIIRPGRLVRYLDAVDVRTIVFEPATHAVATSSRRTFAGGLRDVIEVRDLHCQHPSGGDEPIEHCDVDHFVPWACGGETSQDNGRLSFRFHNRVEPQYARPTNRARHADWSIRWIEMADLRPGAAEVRHGDDGYSDDFANRRGIVMGVVIVTGCRSGFGLHTAVAFGRRGDRVHAVVRDRDRCDELRAAIEAEALPVSVVGLDVTAPGAVEGLVADVLEREGRVDVVVNNAGIGIVASVEEMDEAAARATFETNFWAPLRLIRAVLPHMRAAGGGAIVNVSTFGVRFPGGAGLAMYVASKQALTRLTEAVQAEVDGSGVRLVSIEPGFFATQIYSDDKRPEIDDRSFYAPLLRSLDTRIAASVRGGADAAVVADAIVTAATDPATPTRVLVGEDAISGYRAFFEQQIADWRRDDGVQYGSSSSDRP